MRAPIDPIKYLRGASSDGSASRGRAVHDFLLQLKRAEEEVAASGADADRLLTLYSVNLQSVKKMSAADIVVGVSGDDDVEAIIIHKRMDPNITHPLRMKDVLAKVKPELGLTSYTFQAVTRLRGLRDDERYCWKDVHMNIVRWSHDVVAVINRMSADEVEEFALKYTRMQAG
ncbi:hypothetical protein LWC34_53140 [Kibdelosporangium philippinense]|uniref:EC042-2821-like Restriction Endonuclease-like domain-containing protein n=1 Tax=Kibdelosporangium philippinense TaxID=211113 RepID=A0ABS8ZUT9_9PSEU|nr:hypothetical protein [Kibdelosporangium philippinense]